MMIWVGGFSPQIFGISSHLWVGNPGFYKKADPASHGSKPGSSTHPWLLLQCLPAGSSPACIPALTAFNDELLHGTVREINLFLPKLLWSWYFITAIVTPTKTMPFLCTYVL